MEIDWDVVRTVLAVFGVVASTGVGAFVGVKKVRAVGENAVREEWKDLAQVRAGRIDELEDRLGIMEERISHLEGAYTALQDLKVNEIAARVVDRLLDARVEYEAEGIQKFIQALRNAGLTVQVPTKQENHGI